MHGWANKLQAEAYFNGVPVGHEFFASPSLLEAGRRFSPNERLGVSPPGIE